MNTPMFSIIIPVYQVEKYLEECVQSVLRQTYRDFEIILVDDGSPDSCPRMCDEMETADKRIRVIHKQNGGLSSARNAGLEVARGNYVLFLDSDDFWCNRDGLQNIARQLIDTDADILIFGIRKYYEGDSGNSNPSCYINGNLFIANAATTNELMKTNQFLACACDKAVRRELITINDLAFVDGQLSEDIEWCCRLLQCNPRMTVYGQALYAYRQDNNSSITHNIGRRNLEHISRVIHSYKIMAEKYPEENVFLLNFLAEQYVLWLTVSNLVRKEEIEDLLQTMKTDWDLISYHEYPHVRRVYQVRWAGFEIVRRLLGMYKKMHH